jgi:Tfp pilus assembly protein FimT
MLLSALLLITIFFTIALPAMASQSALDKGTVQLDEITQKTEAAAKTPAMSLNPIDKTAEAGPNEIQGKADRNKMIRSKDTELPVIKQAKKTLK